ncbi:MAG: L-rhamnose mutarotase [Candidatus Moanabacter tarae]|uniref:L-rhamnose mutarotase n=1 Tax=Candidatus Moanibacter tarae TaxID=2200854 RepID=A0A2Z4AG52_9BACT|nr:MAG: L-rhamnose mutarotase [Candidatus Moanabacter tarae]
MKSMSPVGSVLKLRPNCYEEYKRRHDGLWPELADLMRENGINMVIYRFEDFIFCYGTAPSDEMWERVNRHSISQRWNEYMKDVLETDKEGKLIVHRLNQAFCFGDFP